MIRMLITVLIGINLFCLAFAQDTIEGRWHLVGYEDNVMYQFEDNYRYSIYSLDGTFGGLEDAGGSPNPYSVEEDIIHPMVPLLFITLKNGIYTKSSNWADGKPMIPNEIGMA